MLTARMAIVGGVSRWAFWTIVAYLSLTCFLWITPGCAGQTARRNVLDPAIATVWVSIKDDLKDRADADFLAMQRLDEAIASDDPRALSTAYYNDWPGIRAAAVGAIESSTSGMGLKESKIERLRLFDQALRVSIDGS